MKKNVIKMNRDILDVINVVLDYKKFIISENMIMKKKEFDWYKKTQDYYHSLQLPNGMMKNILDFEKILSYGEGNRAVLEELNNTPTEELDQFVWQC